MRRAPSSQRSGLHDLPFVLVAAESYFLLLRNQLDLADLVGIDRQQPLVPQIVRTLVNAGLVILGDGENPRIAVEFGINSVACGGLVAQQELLSLVVFFGQINFKLRWIQTVRN